MRDYILNPKDFKFTAFHDSRSRTGTSGQLYIATGKGLKLLVKCQNHTDVANEYIACGIAERLGFPNPKAYLFKPSSRFRYAVGIEFMENLKPFNVGDMNDTQIDDITHQIALNYLVFQEDRLQMNMWNDRIISYDFSLAFSMESRFFPEFTTSLQNAIRRYSASIMFEPASVSAIVGEGLDIEHVRSEYFQCMKPLLDIDVDGDPLFEAAWEVFPEEIAGYYDVCVMEMKEKVEQQLRAEGYI